jgi:hypothetical protein
MYASNGSITMKSDVCVSPLLFLSSCFASPRPIHPLIRARHDKIDQSLYYLDSCCYDEEEEEEASFGGRE